QLLHQLPLGIHARLVRLASRYNRAEEPKPTRENFSGNQNTLPIVSADSTLCEAKHSPYLCALVRHRRRACRGLPSHPVPAPELAELGRNAACLRTDHLDFTAGGSGDFWGSGLRDRCRCQDIQANPSSQDHSILLAVPHSLRLANLYRPAAALELFLACGWIGIGFHALGCTKRRRAAQVLQTHNSGIPWTVPGGIWGDPLEKCIARA